MDLKEISKKESKVIFHRVNFGLMEFIGFKEWFDSLSEQNKTAFKMRITDCIRKDIIDIYYEEENSDMIKTEIDDIKEKNSDQNDSAYFKFFNENQNETISNIIAKKSNLIMNLPMIKDNEDNNKVIETMRNICNLELLITYKEFDRGFLSKSLSNFNNYKKFTNKIIEYTELIDNITKDDRDQQLQNRFTFIHRKCGSIVEKGFGMKYEYKKCHYTWNNIRKLFEECRDEFKIQIIESKTE